MWSQTGIISWQHPVQNLVNHSFICTIFAKREKSSVNDTLLCREQTPKSLPGVSLPGPSLLLHTHRHVQSYMYASLPAPLPPYSESARSAAVTHFPPPPPKLLSRGWGTQIGSWLLGRFRGGKRGDYRGCGEGMEWTGGNPPINALLQSPEEPHLTISLNTAFWVGENLYRST